MALKDIFEDILEQYPTQKNTSREKMEKLVRWEACQQIKNFVGPFQYDVQGSIGKGAMADIPWVAIFDTDVTRGASKGYYPVYLFSKDGNRMYLSLCLAVEDSSDDSLNERVRQALDYLKPGQNYCCGKIDLDNPGLRGRKYEKGSILAKCYKKGAVPDDDILKKDLSEMLAIYEKYKKFVQGETFLMSDNEEKQESDIDKIKNFISSKGFSYPEGLIEDYYLSLKSKPFVILAGTSGTGKTRLVKLFAQAVGSTFANGRFCLISVRPDWSDFSDLLGHLDLKGKFNPGEALDFISEANHNLEENYFLCLDEMNLARVEYYFSDFLSVMETRERDENGNIITKPLLPISVFGTDEEAKNKYSKVYLSKNLFFIGTVNMDETTFPFSKKVLDRANTIEFNYVHLMPVWPDFEEKNFKQVKINLSSEYLLLCDLEKDKEYVQSLCTKLEDINQILLPNGMNYGYRVRDEICFFMENNRKLSLLSEEEAFDFEIMQKILPRIQGNSSSVEHVLCELFKYCASDYTEIEGDFSISEKMNLSLKKNQPKYKRSAEKILFMMERMENDGFTSYWF